MIQYYAPEIAETLTLPEEEARHCLRVLRTQIGECVEVVDGHGHRYTCRVLSTDPRKATVEITGVTDVPTFWAAPLTVAVAPTKNIDRIEWLVEKAVEIGVGRIVPLLCRRSERKVVKSERLVKIAVSAMKQSLKSYLPQVDALTDIKSFVNKQSELHQTEQRQLMFGYCSAEFKRSPFVRNYNPQLPLTVLIGPEGDFSPEEVTLLVDNGFLPVTFGEQRLRTETAGLYALEGAHILYDLNNNE